MLVRINHLIAMASRELREISVSSFYGKAKKKGNKNIFYIELCILHISALL